LANIVFVFVEYHTAEAEKRRNMYETCYMIAHFCIQVKCSCWNEQC